MKGINPGDTSWYIGKTGAIDRCSAYSRGELCSKGLFFSCHVMGTFLLDYWGLCGTDTALGPCHQKWYKAGLMGLEAWTALSSSGTQESYWASGNRKTHHFLFFFLSLSKSGRTVFSLPMVAQLSRVKASGTRAECEAAARNWAQLLWELPGAGF